MHKLYARAFIRERRRSPLLTRLEIIIVVNPHRPTVFYDYRCSLDRAETLETELLKFSVNKIIYQLTQSRILTFKTDMYTL